MAERDGFGCPFKKIKSKLRLGYSGSVFLVPLIADPTAGAVGEEGAAVAVSKLESAIRKLLAKCKCADHVSWLGFRGELPLNRVVVGDPE